MRTSGLAVISRSSGLSVRSNSVVAIFLAKFIGIRDRNGREKGCHAKPHLLYVALSHSCAARVVIGTGTAYITRVRERCHFGGSFGYSGGVAIAIPRRARFGTARNRHRRLGQRLSLQELSGGALDQ